MFAFCGSFQFFWGIQITLFCRRSGIQSSTSCVNLHPYYFKSDMNTSQCKLNVQVAGISFWLIFDAPIVYMSSYCRWKELGTTGMSFESTVQDQVTPFLKLRLLLMFAGLKRLEMRVIKVFFNQESEGTVSYILSVKWLSGCMQ